MKQRVVDFPVIWTEGTHQKRSDKKLSANYVLPEERSQGRIHSPSSLYRSSKAKRTIFLEMNFHFIGMLLLSLHTVGLVETSRRPQKLVMILATAGESVTIGCVSPVREIVLFSLTLYKEDQDQSLRKIDNYIQYSKSGFFSVNLTISHAQRNDSGVYYCAQFIDWKFDIVSGTRLIISDASSPSPSIFMPLFIEGSQLLHGIPLLCVFFDTRPSWDVISWEIGRGTSHEDQKGVRVIDGEGIVSIWSLKLIPPEKWIPGMSYHCSDQEKRTIGAGIPTNPTTKGNCIAMLYIRIPCIVALLAVPLLVALFWKQVFGGKVRKPANETPMRQMPQTEFAELRSSR